MKILSQVDKRPFRSNDGIYIVYWDKPDMKVGHYIIVRGTAQEVKEFRQYLKKENKPWNLYTRRID